MNSFDLPNATLDTVTAKAMSTAKSVNQYMQQVKIDKLQRLHDQERMGPRNTTLEQEQEEQEQEEEEEEEEEEEGNNDIEVIENTDDNDNVYDDEEEEEEDFNNNKSAKYILDTSADMFGSLGPRDKDLVQSVLLDLDEEEEEDTCYTASNELQNADDLF